MNRSHKIDISGILAGIGQVLLIDDQVPIEDFEGIAFPQPARVHLEVRHVDRLLHVEGEIEVEARGECDRCLTGVERVVHVDIDERLDPSGNREIDPFGEENVLTENRLDVADLTQQLVLCDLPMGLRCSDDCLGLCGKCGTNKNASICSCDNGESRGKSQMEDASQ